MPLKPSSNTTPRMMRMGRSDTAMRMTPSLQMNDEDTGSLSSGGDRSDEASVDDEAEALAAAMPAARTSAKKGTSSSNREMTRRRVAC